MLRAQAVADMPLLHAVPVDADHYEATFAAIELLAARRPLDTKGALCFTCSRRGVTPDASVVSTAPRQVTRRSGPGDGSGETSGQGSRPEVVL